MIMPQHPSEAAAEALAQVNELMARCQVFPLSPEFEALLLAQRIGAQRRDRRRRHRRPCRRQRGRRV